MLPQAIYKHLDKDEEVLWSGRPSRLVFWVKWTTLSIVGGGAIIGMAFLVNEFLATPVFLAMSLIAGVGYFGWRDWGKRRGKHYLLTGRRIMIVRPHAKQRQVYRAPYGEVESIKLLRIVPGLPVARMRFILRRKSAHAPKGIINWINLRQPGRVVETLKRVAPNLAKRLG